MPLGLLRICFTFLNYMYGYVSIWWHVHLSEGAHQGKKWALALLEMELQVVVSCLVWVGEADLGSSERALLVLNH